MGKIIVITQSDFDNFKNELLTEIKSIFESNIKKQQWMRSKEVREMLGISDAKLQNLRINKTSGFIIWMGHGFIKKIKLWK